MTLTRDFKDTVKARADRDPAFRKALVAEAVNCLVNNDLETMKILLRDYINATDGFELVAAAVKTPSKSLMRMLSPTGNPQVRTLSPVFRYAVEREGIHGFAVAA
jgi:DNA-binding phage protein